VDLLARYRDWLITEAVSSGLLGPAEVSRVDKRHIADSLLFAAPMNAPEEIWDLGSGAGLPGIPLAILFPGTSVILIDRSGRCVDMLNRVTRILNLHNVEVRPTAIDELTGTTSSIVSRASLPPPKLTDTVKRLLVPGGLAVVGGSWTERPLVDDWETVEIPPDILDHVVWLLIMRRQ
jgi:16S rRNA (guanine527-N7)-methyltransferase